MIDTVRIRRGDYHDSVQLMAVSALLQRWPGVREALVAMATKLNLELVANLGFDVAGDVGADDLIVAIRADEASGLEAALAELENRLAAPEPRTSETLFTPPEPRTIAGAAAKVGAKLALISVPGPHAYVEAMEAISAGLHVMVFSNNVSVEHEIRMKNEAGRRGLLVMGPDCGTAIIGGVGLGFANATVPGRVSLVGASGTGIQQVCCLLDDAGVGIRHALGTGGRDLSDAVGGLSTVLAIRALDADPGTELIVVISKPPDPGVAAVIRDEMDSCATRSVEAFVGRKTLEEAAHEALELLGHPRAPLQSPPNLRGADRRGALLGLYSGGTLRDEAEMVLAPLLGAIHHDPDTPGHVLIDFGDDRYTSGRAHPMIDFRLRLDALEAASQDPGVGVILLDVVLGFGVHPDPASELVPMIDQTVGAGIPVVVALIGTQGDPQQRDEQRRRLTAAGASVLASNAQAARWAGAMIHPRGA